MGTFVYTARRSLMAGHVVGNTYVIEIGAQSSPRRRRVEKSVVRAKGGAMEVLRHYADTERAVTFEPVAGVQLDQLREFLDSVEGGEQFQADIYGGGSAMKAYKRNDDSYSEELFQDVGSADKDYYAISVIFLET
jgi:hypothetical protein